MEPRRRSIVLELDSFLEDEQIDAVIGMINGAASLSFTRGLVVGVICGVGASLLVAAIVALLAAVGI